MNLVMLHNLMMLRLLLPSSFKASSQGTERGNNNELPPLANDN